MLALPFLLGIHLLSVWSPPFLLLHSSALIALSRQGVIPVHLDSLLPHDLVIWTDGSVSVFLGKSGSSILANCFLCGTKATLFFLAGPVCSSFSAEACTILHALCWSRQHQQVCHFSSLYLLTDSHFVLATLFSAPSFFLSRTL